MLTKIWVIALAGLIAYASFATWRWQATTKKLGAYELQIKQLQYDLKEYDRAIALHQQLAEELAAQARTRAVDREVRKMEYETIKDENPQLTEDLHNLNDASLHQWLRDISRTPNKN